MGLKQSKKGKKKMVIKHFEAFINIIWAREDTI